MARVTIPDEGRTLAGADVTAFLLRHGLRHERWPVEGRVDPAAPAEAVLAAYAPELERLRRDGGYVTADVIDVTPDLPGLDAMLGRFSKEHVHDEDEVRFVVRGRGVFHIRPADGPVFAVELEPGDLLAVPAGARHWFGLCAERTIRAVRLFKDQSGWVPHYVGDGSAARYAPACWGPSATGYRLPAIGQNPGDQPPLLLADSRQPMADSRSVG